MSRAVLSWRRFGRPEALRKLVRFMPRVWAFLFICWANLRSVLPSASARTTATSLADLVTRARIACLTVIRWLRFSPSFEGGWRAARRDTLSL